MNPSKNLWYPVVQLSTLFRSKKESLTLFDIPLLLVQGEGGVVHVLEDRCPDRSAPLSKGSCSKTSVRCPFHGWEFSFDGRLKSVPYLDSKDEREEKVRIRTYPSRIYDGFVWVCLDRVNTPSFPFDEKNHPCVKQCQLSGSVNADSWLVAENLLDGTHVDSVHQGLIKKSSDRKSVPIRVVESDHKIEAFYPSMGEGWGLISRLLGAGLKNIQPKSEFSSYNRASLIYETDADAFMRVSLYLTPVAEKKCQYFVSISYRHFIPLWLFRCLALPLFKIAIWQDRRIVEKCVNNASRFSGKGRMLFSGDLMGQAIARIMQGKGLQGGKREYSVSLRL